MSKAALIVTALAGMGALESGFKVYKPREPKNKLNLTDEQIEKMEAMTAKEKKKFLRGLK